MKEWGQHEDEDEHGDHEQQDQRGDGDDRGETMRTGRKSWKEVQRAGLMLNRHGYSEMPIRTGDDNPIRSRKDAGWTPNTRVTRRCPTR